MKKYLWYAVLIGLGCYGAWLQYERDGQHREEMNRAFDRIEQSSKFNIAQQDLIDSLWSRTAELEAELARLKREPVAGELANHD